MFTLHGTGVGKGIAIGTAFVLKRTGLEIPEYTVADEDVENECQRFRAAIGSARAQLRGIRDHITGSAPTEVLTFLDAHLLMLDDPLIKDAPLRLIREERRNAEWALALEGRKLIEVFDQMDDPYLRTKKTDIDQVVQRVQRVLLNVHEESLDEIAGGLAGQIVVTTDLSPADTVLMKHHHMLAFVTDLGGPISHTAILARSLKIPAIVGMHGASRYIRHGETLIVDGKRGAAIVAPDASLIEAYRQRQARIAEQQLSLQLLVSEVPRTRDGERITLMANIELPEDIPEVKKVGAEGVGLYRTEYLFMNRSEAPSEEEQFRQYASAVRALGRPVTIRTLDLGADKQVDGRRPENAPTNPALGLRAVRLCLTNPGLFRPQLRAILRASALGPVEMMIPMLSSIEELDQVLEMVRETKQELRREEITFNERLRVGAMIEVPAAAVAADLFAKRVDFMSIGTNDLIQYTLAIDRVDDTVNYLYDPLHPSVLRLIQHILDAGKHARIPVAMCGEMAGDVRFTRLLLGMGLRQFSMDPVNLLEVKKIVRDTNARELEDRVSRIFDTADPVKMRELVDRL
jgi:phosphotransferase system enzyme I (PtsI)